MKTNLTFTLIMSFGLLIIGCKQEEKKVKVEEVKTELINYELSDEEAEVMAFMDELTQTMENGEADKLVSMHEYGPKFTAFAGGNRRAGSAEDEKNERSLFENDIEVIAFNYDDLKIAVYGNVANVTYHSDYQMKFNSEVVNVNNKQVTLLLVKTNTEWKIVHEHFSGLKMDEKE